MGLIGVALILQISNLTRALIPKLHRNTQHVLVPVYTCMCVCICGHMYTTMIIYESENISTKSVLLSHHVNPNNCTWVKLVLYQQLLPAKSFLLPWREIFLSMPSWHYLSLITYLNNHFFKRWSVISEATLTRSSQMWARWEYHQWTCQRRVEKFTKPQSYTTLSN